MRSMSRVGPCRMSAPRVDRSLIEQAGRRLREHVRLTPLTRDRTTGIWLKRENEQTTGSFKLRGALNRCLQLSPAELSRGLVAASAGNHGQGVAFAARLRDTRAIVVVPLDAIQCKVDAIRALGAEVRTVPGGYAAAELEGERLASETGGAWISPYNDIEVIAGQGTVGLEIEGQWGDAQLRGPAEVFVPVGGGGLAAGIGAALDAWRPGVRVIGVLPEASPYLHAYFHTGSMAEVVEYPTLADGLSGPVEESSITLSLVRRYVDDMILVSESEIREAMRWAHSRGVVAEPSAAVAIAACLRGRSETRLAVVSGGNVDPRMWQEVTAGGRS
jgi:threonine dehydratase